MSDRYHKIGCTNAIYSKAAIARAAIEGLDPGRLLRGDLTHPYTVARWGVWVDLAKRGFSYKSIGVASGFDHTSVMHACKVGRGPNKGGNPYPVIARRRREQEAA